MQVCLLIVALLKVQAEVTNRFFLYARSGEENSLDQ